MLHLSYSAKMRSFHCLGTIWVSPSNPRIKQTQTQIQIEEGFELGGDSNQGGKIPPGSLTFVSFCRKYLLRILFRASKLSSLASNWIQGSQIEGWHIQIEHPQSAAPHAPSIKPLHWIERQPTPLSIQASRIIYFIYCLFPSISSLFWLFYFFFF